LAQQEGLEAPDIRMLHDGATAEVGEPSPPSGLSRDLSFLDPQLGKRILTCWILSFYHYHRHLMLWFAESTRVAQVEDLAASIGAEDSTVQTSIGELSAVEFAVASVIVEAATTITIPEVLVTTSMSDEPIVGLTPVQVELVPVCHPVMKRWSRSTLAGLSPANNIMEELARQMVRQFFASMRSYIDLVLSGGSSFEFARMLFKN